MVGIDVVRESNARARELHGLVAVFMGGTGGIGEGTAKEMFRRATKPKAFIIGRSVDRGNALVKLLEEINPGSEAIFLPKDISLMQNVDEVCDELKRLTPKINCLFLTAGYMTLKGRSETSEGIDRKMSVNYYSRIRCILNLMPLLTAASDANQISRVITVLAAGSEGEVNLDDLDLRHNFTLHACLAHCVVMSDFAIEQLSRRHPGTSFSHSYPGTVKTGIVNELNGPLRLTLKLMYAVLTPWLLNVQESGERHFFQMTSRCYPAARGGVGLPIPDGLTVFDGMNGEPGGGAYLLDWDGKTTGDQRVLGKYRELDMGTRVWEHTMGILRQADERIRKQAKRPASGEAEGSGQRSVPNPIGWRPG